MSICKVCSSALGPDGQCVQCEPAIDPRRAPTRETLSPWEEIAFSIPREVVESRAEEQFGRYVKISLLGSGSFGDVWKAWDRNLERWIALKLLKRLELHDVRRFVREARTVAALDHPRIAKIHDAGEVEGQYFIAMQLVRGETLDKRVLGPVRRSVELVRDVAEAVHYAHTQGYIHRDLKPGNLMVETRDAVDHVYVLDFGLARWVPAPTAGSGRGIVGTLQFMAPEQARGRELDARADVYALGATLYQLLTGEFAHRIEAGEDYYEILRRIVEEQRTPPSASNAEVDPDLDRIVMHCLEKDPARRISDARELARRLSGWLDAQGTGRTAQITVPWPSFPPPTDSKPFGDRYAICEALGKGGFSKVWRAFDRRLGCSVAIKVYRDPASAHVSRAILRSIEVGSRAVHPGIVPVCDAGEVGTNRYLTMQLIEGGTTLDQFELELQEKIRLVRDAALAVHYLNELGYHRFDVKPQNLLVARYGGESPHVFLTDFDVAISAEDRDDDIDVSGTVAFMCPEQFSGGRGDRRMDVYAIGATLYKLISGRPPVGGSNFAAMMKSAAAGEIIPLRSVAPEVDVKLERIVARCLQREPERRFATAADVADELTDHVERRRRAWFRV